MICLKIRTFVVSTTTDRNSSIHGWSCDLLENSYLCGINNNSTHTNYIAMTVVICLKIRTFVVSTTTLSNWSWAEVSCDLLENSYLCGINNNQSSESLTTNLLWFAWKFVPLWYQQQLRQSKARTFLCCDLLENSYLCGINNNSIHWLIAGTLVVICLKIRTFVVSTTTR